MSTAAISTGTGSSFESIADTGTRLCFTWDASAPGVINWRNEMSLGDGSWFLIEEYPMIPA
jgi:hypothetical protein